ncbi:MAG TPA: glycoside hydrolase family 95 protein, partial [Lacipirellulaceae bacterium]|nr:glycoside hydrolase family 95 protein [Lacipirellulaceae bacterium]
MNGSYQTGIISILIGFAWLSAAQAESNDELVLWYEKPAAEWVEALPIGNGRLGAMIFGGFDTERIQFNDNTLFTGKPHDYAHEGASKYLPVLRKLLFEGKQQEAHELANREFMSVSTRDGNRLIRQEKYQPFGDLLIVFPGHGGATDYRRDLDIERAVASVEYKAGGVKFRRELFASRPNDAIVMRIAADQPGKLGFRARLETPHEMTAGRSAESAAVLGDSTASAIIVLRGKVSDGDTRFEARLLARVEGEQAQTSSNGETILVTGADAATLLLVGATSFVNYKDISGDPAAKNDRAIERFRDRSYEELRDAHVDDYQSLFDRVTLDLGKSKAATQPTDQRIKAFQRQHDPQLAALYFQFGRYLLIACSRPGTQPANLQGLWNESLN